MPAYKVGYLVGSLAKASINRKLAKALVRLAPFVRVFANNLGNGRWFDTIVQNLTAPVGFCPGTYDKNGTQCTGTGGTP